MPLIDGRRGLDGFDEGSCIGKDGTEMTKEMEAADSCSLVSEMGTCQSK
jgi:hypothetical protein